MSRRRAATTLVAVAVALSIIGLLAPPGYAATFVVTTCGHAPDYVNNSWVAGVSDDGTVVTSDRCATDGDHGGLAILEKLGPGPLADPGDNGSWTLTAPSGTRIRALSASRWGHKVPDDSWRPELRIDSTVVETCNFRAGFDECAFGGRALAPRSFVGLEAASVSASGSCFPDDGAPACDRGANIHSLELVLYGATVTLEDLDPPALAGRGSVPLADGAWHNATSATISLPAATDNTGIRERLAWVGDELVKVWTAPGADQNGCGDLNAGIAYTFVTPCAGARGLNAAMLNETLPLGAVADGVHTLRLSAVDTGGLEARTAGVEIRLDRSAPAAPVCDIGSTAWLTTSSGTVACTPEAGSSSGAPITSVEIEVCPESGSAPCTVTTTAPGTQHAAPLSEGTTSVRARQIDAAGNVGAWSATQTWRRDRTAPTISLIAPSGIVDHGTRLTAWASVSDAQAGATAVLWYSVDAGSWLRYSGAVTAQAGRSYRFRATSADAAGNVGLEQTSLPITVRPATEPPAESPSSPPSTEAPPDGVTAPAAGGEAEPALPTAPTPSTVSTPIFASAPITTQTPARASAGVRITSATRRRGTLTVFGAMNARATGRVRVSVMGRIGRRTIRASKVAAVRRGHFRASFRLAGRLRSTTARVQYAGDARFRPQSAFKRA